MRLGLARLKRHVAGLTAYVERWGAEVPDLPELLEDETGLARFEIVGRLPGQETGQPGLIELRELWSRVGLDWELQEYEYELIDREAGRRRAFHLHDAAHFIAAFRIVVHEHCEEELGRPTCAHYAGEPLDNGYEGLERLIAAWLEPGPLACSDLRCLD